METIEYRTIDKTGWGDGPWQSEPDKRQWQDEATGLPCLIVRGPVGVLCGYVGVPEGHIAFGMDYDKADGEFDLSVHGGLTFANMCAATADETHGICHKPAPGEPDHIWWFGFDCAHCDDLAPKPRRFASVNYRLIVEPHQTYRDLAYVEAECRKLAAQLIAITESPVASRAG